MRWLRFRWGVSATLALALVLATVSPGVAVAGSVREAYSKFGFGGWVTSIAVDATKPARVFASTAYLSDPPGGAFVSADFGTSWMQIMSGMPIDPSMGSVALETAGATVYAGSGVGGKGICKSTDSGSTWRQVVTWTGEERVRDIRVDPLSVWNIFAVTAKDDETAPNVRYSMDGGSHWATHDISVASNECRVALCVDVGKGGRLLVGGENVEWTSGPRGGGVFVSDNYGSTWKRTGCLDMSVEDIAVCPTNRNIVYACARESYADKGGLYKSTDGGDTWKRVSMPSAASPNNVQVDSLGRVFVGSRKDWSDTYGGVHQSDDGGVTWKQVASFRDDQGTFSLELDRAGAYLYAGVGSGVSRYWVPSAEEIFGDNRYLTAIQTSRTRFPTSNTAGCVVVVSGVNFPDATVAAPFAAANDGTILLSREEGLDAATMKEIDRLLPSGGDVYVIGGTAAVPGTVDTALKGKGYKVERIAGRDRYATSAAVASELGTCTACFVANGTAFPDVLSASAPAADFGIPILLTRRDSLPSTVQKYLDNNTDKLEVAYIAGDATVVGAGVASDLEDYADNVVCLGGHTRYDTSLAIAKRFYPVPTKAAGLATGELYPDGLTGSILCAYQGGPLVLTRAHDLPTNTATYLKSGKPKTMTVFGGRAAVGVEARYELEWLW